MRCGRKFIPRGSLKASWNLILQSCVSCNSRKSDLEDDISALTMQPDAFGEHATTEEQLRNESTRKGKRSISRSTRKPVHKSWDKREFTLELAPGVSAALTFVAPPQLAPERSSALASLQLAALFYWITYNSDTSIGHFCPGEVGLIDLSPRRDWGNALQLTFMRGVQSWEHRVFAIAAGEYFKVAIRRHPSAVCWSWALEWNQNVRLIGFMGERSAIDSAAEMIEVPTAAVIPHHNGHTSMRTENELSAADDLLFAIPTTE